MKNLMVYLVLCLIALLVSAWAYEFSRVVALEIYQKELFKHALVLANLEHKVWLHNGELAEENNSCHLFLQKKGLTTIYTDGGQHFDEGGS